MSFTFTVDVELYETYGPLHDRAVEYLGPVEIVVQAKAGENVYALIRQEIAKRGYGDEFEITSIYFSA